MKQCTSKSRFHCFIEQTSVVSFMEAWAPTLGSNFFYVAFALNLYINTGHPSGNETWHYRRYFRILVLSSAYYIPNYQVNLVFMVYIGPPSFAIPRQIFDCMVDVFTHFMMCFACEISRKGWPINVCYNIECCMQKHCTLMDESLNHHSFSIWISLLSHNRPIL